MLTFRQLTGAKAHLDQVAMCLTLALPLLKELNDAFGPPFVQPIVNTIQSLINLVQNVKQNKNECVQLMENIHHILYAVVELHIKSETVGSLPPSKLDNIGKFVETLHKIYTFVEAQQQGKKIKHLFGNNEMNKLLQDCHARLKQAQEIFGIQTQTQTLDEIREFRKTANLMHNEMMELIENLSENTVSERSSVYLGVNESENSSNSFAMLPSKPKIFHGCEQELNDILKLISQQPPRIAILGGGGMGKTSLARAVLHHPDTSSKFEHQFFVSAEAATTSVELAALIGLHVGLKSGQDLTKPVVQYFSRKMSCLLILDNLETVWEPIHSRAGVEEFLSLLTSLEHLALIITMRGAERPAKVGWTHPFLLPLQPLSNDAARQTFIEITDNSNTLEEMEQLLGFTDNMPLAVDLIAHLVDYEGFSSVLSRWKTEKTSLLSVGFDRQSSVDTSLSLSLSSPRITSDSKELLSPLSILPNGLSEAELVQGKLGIRDILTCKAALLATSLAYRDNNQRLVLLMPIREYIQRVSPPSLAHIQCIHKYFCALLLLYTKYQGEQVQPVVHQITLNLANLQDILQWGLQAHTPILADTIQCALILNKFYVITGRGYSPLMNDIESPLSQLCDHQLEITFLIQLLTTQHYWPVVSGEMIAQAISYVEHTTDPALGSQLYGAVGQYFFYHKGDAQQGSQFFHKALEKSELCESSKWQCSAMIQLGHLKLETGNYSAAMTYATAVQKLSQVAGNLYQEGIANYAGARLYHQLGDYQKSMAQLQRAGELLHICGMSRSRLAHEITVAQAEIHLLKSEYAEARHLFCQVTETTSAEENPFSYANSLLNVGLIDVMISKAKEDIYHKLQVAQEIMRRESTIDLIACGPVEAMVEFRDEKFDSVKAKFQECLCLSWGKIPEVRNFCLEQLANIKAWPADMWEYKWPIIYLACASRSKGKLDLHKALLFLGDAFSANHDENSAANLYQVAMAGFTRMDVHRSRAQCLLRLRDQASKDGCTSEAISFWEAARPLFERASQTKDIAQIDSRLATWEKDHHQALVKLETLHAPIHLGEREILEIKGEDSIDKDTEEHTVPIMV
ncbi:hypothetical protein K438DRAFT_1875014 [Mycena galopus ATCC 62051]|nr:hypothetical protein K438DRAFT_1875014 [Mycena galopus ATCC 62051]